VMYTKNYPNFNLVYGMEFSQPVYFSDRIKEGKQTFKQNGVFIQTDIDIHNSFDLVTGARLDRFQDTVVVSPRLAVSYKKNNWKLRGAYGYGFRSPSFMESLIDWEHVQFGYTVIGNQNLRPEVSRGMTLGVEYTNNENFQTSLLLYQNRFNNLIEDYAIQPGILSYRNINIAKFSGFEWTSKLAIGSKISFSSTYNYVENVDGDNNKLPNTVPHSLGSRISIALLKNKILLSFNNKLVGTYFPQEFDPSLGDYTSSEKAIKGSSISDLVIQYRLHKTNKILLGINNVSNFTNDVYGPYIGRVAYIEIQKSITNKGT
ncbi:TonB-dependent receptor, partial [Candidatus Marinimicrobia bacterium]|nr:TonB-dependent receptor [Candidatus Neomarinimicrobiota bacterium]